MIYSMTGFATAARSLSHCVLSVELRAVNSRYLDLSFRMPEELRGFESQLRERLSVKVRRGKVEIRASIADLPATERNFDLNVDVIERLAAASKTVRAIVPEAAPLRSIDIMRWPGVIGEAKVTSDELGAACLDLIEKAIEDFNATRAREGGKLADVILERAASMQALVDQVTPKIPQLVSAYQDKLVARLKEAALSPDDDRIRQEIVLFASKIDVDEELSRLRAHIKELRHTLQQGGAVGRRLDFLMQEFNREANTLGAKASDLEITQAAVELKVLIEQMREQVQNIE
jgi:uncharacterized protein (TIGR00255 family)